MENYYNILQVDITSSNDYIKSSYNNKIKQFYNKNILSQNDINYIKLLKTSLFILTSSSLKIKYNKLLFNNNIDNKKINNNIDNIKLDNIDDGILTHNTYNNLNNINNNIDNNLNNIDNNIDNNFNNIDDNFNNIFNIDNKWMDNISINNDTEKKLDNNIINNRIFTLHSHNNKYEDNFLKPISCRDYKKE